RGPGFTPSRVARGAACRPGPAARVSLLDLQRLAELGEVLDAGLDLDLAGQERLGGLEFLLREREQVVGGDGDAHLGVGVVAVQEVRELALGDLGVEGRVQVGDVEGHGAVEPVKSVEVAGLLGDLARELLQYVAAFVYSGHTVLPIRSVSARRARLAEGYNVRWKPLRPTGSPWIGDAR